MAIQLNTFSKNGLINSLRSATSLFGGTSVLRLYPNTVPFPSNPVDAVSGLPGGHIVSYSGLVYTSPSNTITIQSGTTTVAATAAGTLSWWAIVGNVDNLGAIVSDSITLSGGGGIVIVNTLTPSLSQNVTVAFNLSIG